MTEATLWKWFSLYIRLRDSDDHGYVKCFTCPGIHYYKEMDAGHGIGSQHRAVKYSEKNVHPQCTDCNKYHEGRKDRYKENVDKRYGAGTWDMLELFSHKQTKKPSVIEMKVMSNFYMNKVKVLIAEKQLV